MNYSTAIFLVNKDARAVSVSYDRSADGKGVQPFTPFKTFDRKLKVGDLVIIPTDTRHLMTVGRVEEVDVEVDFDSGVQMKWLVDAVDTGAYHSILSQEGEAIQAMKSAEQRSKREELARKLLADNPDLEGLSIVTATAPALAAPPAA